MIVLVSGGSGTGKSAIAETIAQKMGGKMIYIATMPIRNSDDLIKIERHHKLRAGKGFETVERQLKIEDIPDADTVLLECLSTHTSNIMFSKPSDNDSFDWYSSNQCFEIISEEIDYLSRTFRNVIFVSAESNLEGCIYDEITEDYKRALVEVNKYVTELADCVIESVVGLPCVIKGEFS